LIGRRLKDYQDIALLIVWRLESCTNDRVTEKCGWMKMYARPRAVGLGQYPFHSVFSSRERTGFSFALDECGTGYSLPTRLQRLSVARLKIDIASLQGMLVDVRQRTTVALSHRDGPCAWRAAAGRRRQDGEPTTAVHDLGCDSAHRYWFGDPVPATVFAENWLSTKSDVLLL